MFTEVEVQLHAFLTYALDGGEWSDSRLCLFTIEERSLSAHWSEGCVRTRVVSDTVAKTNVPGIETVSLRLMSTLTIVSTTNGVEHL
jgi:hypothetical protein